ncbi:hypothetical protein IKO70_02920 [bacterium]|nr:hypothetical protein [bacterium]
MTTVVFLLQKCQFSAVIGDKRCYLRGEESVSLAESDAEKIVEFFENSDYFKGWNDTKLFILYDSKSAKYLFNIIDGFELKNKVDQCKNFSFQIKLEEKPIDLNGNIAAILEKVDSAAASEIGKLKKDIDDLKKEIERQKSENDRLSHDVAEKESEISDLEKQIKNLKSEIALKDEEKKELKKWYDDWDCFAEANIIDNRENTGILELKKPVGDIHKIYISKNEVTYSDADKLLKTMNMGGGMQWRFPTEEECEILKKLYHIPEVSWLGHHAYSRFFNTDWWHISGGKKFYNLNSDYKGKIQESRNDYKWPVLFVC